MTGRTDDGGMQYTSLSPEAREEFIGRRLAQLEQQHYGHHLDCIRFRAVIGDLGLPEHEREEARRLLEQAEASMAVLEVAHTAELSALQELRRGASAPPDRAADDG